MHLERQSNATRVVDSIEKQLLLNRNDFGEGKPIFYQWFWLEPQTEYVRHRHTGMKELIGVIEGEVEIVLQESINGAESSCHLVSGEVQLVHENILHTLRNISGSKSKLFALGIATQEGGMTLRE